MESYVESLGVTLAAKKIKTKKKGKNKCVAKKKKLSVKAGKFSISEESSDSEEEKKRNEQNITNSYDTDEESLFGTNN